MHSAKMFEAFIKYLCLFAAIYSWSVRHLLAQGEEIPRGHGQILGKHRDPGDRGTEETGGHLPVLTELPSPQEFWDKYVSIRRPVIFRGPGKLFPAHKLWTDEYLTNNFGKLEVKLEHKTEKGKTPVGSKGVGRDTIEDFLATYKDKSKYIVSQMPDPMAKHVLVPPFMMCGTIYERLLESNLWLSSGGTKSMLHRDADHALNCLLNGTKDWILIDSRQEDKIPIAKGDRGYGGFAVLDVDKVNLLKYPKFKDVKWEYANMTAGDCLYLPCGYWHQVRSYGTKNVAVTVLWSRIKSYNGSDCKTKKLEYTPLSDTGMIWTYPGYGAQTLGNLDPFELRENLLRIFDEDGKKLKKLTWKRLQYQHPALERENYDEWKDEAMALGKKIVSLLDLDNKGYVTKEDLHKASIQQLKDVADAIDPDPANTDIYEHWMFHPPEVKNIIEESIDKNRRVLTLQSLIKNWMKHGGSEKIATEVFGTLKGDLETEELPEDVTRQGMGNLLNLFKKRRADDPSGIYYGQQLKEDKKMMGDDQEGDDADEEDGEKEDNREGQEDDDEEGDTQEPETEPTEDQSDNEGESNEERETTNKHEEL